MAINGIKTIGVCIAGIDEDYSSEFIHILTRISKGYNIRILYFYSFSHFEEMGKHEDGEKQIFDLMNFNILDGIILLKLTFYNDQVSNEIINRANRFDVPIIVLEAEAQGVHSIFFNHDEGQRQLVTHLIVDHDITDFYFMSGIKGNYDSEHRLEYFRDILKRYNIELPDDHVGYGAFWYKTAEELIGKYLDSGKPLPQAFVCANDSMAIGVFNKLVASGYRVPEDVIVTGMDGISEALHHTPPITTVQINKEEAVIRSIELLLRGEAKKNETTVVNSKLLIGGSCGCGNKDRLSQNRLIRNLLIKNDKNEAFNKRQLKMLAELTNKNSFQDVFEDCKNFIDEFGNRYLWVCIVDNFLSREEFSDILEETKNKKSGFSSKVDLMMCRQNNEWMGITDFETKDLLPHMDEIIDDVRSIAFFPLHFQDEVIGYFALSIEESDNIDINGIYTFFMHLSVALAVTRANQRQETIIQNLENKYVHDPLTGLFNRRGFFQRTPKIFKACQENNQTLMIVSVDLNGLKPINDNYGHADGDLAISTVAKALKHCGSIKGFICARFGGDEFVVAGKLADDDTSDSYINDVKAYLDDFNESSGKPYKVSASFGVVASVPSDTVSLDEFIRNADELMYEEKAKNHLARSR